MSPPVAYVTAASAFWSGGRGAGALVAAMDAGTTAPRGHVPDRIGARMPSIDDETLTAALRLRGLRPLSRTARLAMVAAAEVWPPGAADGSGRDAVVFGSRWASVDPLAEFVQTAVHEGPDRVFPMGFPNTVASVHAGYVASLLGLDGPNVSVCGAAAGTEAVVESLSLLQSGRADRVLAVAADALDATVAAGVADIAAGGPAPGEGAAALRLERTAAGAPLAAVAGWRVASAREALGDVGPDRVWEPESADAAIEAVAGDCQAASGALRFVAAAMQVASTQRPLVLLDRSGVRGWAVIELVPATASRYTSKTLMTGPLTIGLSSTADTPFPCPHDCP